MISRLQTLVLNLNCCLQKSSLNIIPHLQQACIQQHPTISEMFGFPKRAQQINLRNRHFEKSLNCLNQAIWGITLHMHTVMHEMHECLQSAACVFARIYMHAACICRRDSPNQIADSAICQ